MRKRITGGAGDQGKATVGALNRLQFLGFFTRGTKYDNIPCLGFVHVDIYHILSAKPSTIEQTTFEQVWLPNHPIINQCSC